ncbi:MAG: hypothetical protein AB7O98_17515 [Hyphomonadaceae bacterium]
MSRPHKQRRRQLALMAANRRDREIEGAWARFVAPVVSVGVKFGPLRRILKGTLRLGRRRHRNEALDNVPNDFAEIDFARTGAYVGVKFTRASHGINRAMYPYAAAFADLVEAGAVRSVGEAALQVMPTNAQGEPVTVQYACRYIKAELEKAGRADLYDGAKNRSGRPA